MEQTFHDLCRERLAEGRPVHAFAAGLFVEAIAGLERTIRSHHPLLVYEVLARAHALQDLKMNPQLTEDERQRFLHMRAKRITDLDAKLRELGCQSYFIHRNGDFSPIASLEAADDLDELELNFLAVSNGDRAAFERHAASRLLT